MRPRVFKASLSKDRASIRSAAGKNLTAFDEATARSNVFHHLSFSATMPAVYWDCLKMRQLTQELTSVQITLKLTVFSEFFGPRRKIIMWKKFEKVKNFREMELDSIITYYCHSLKQTLPQLTRYWKRIFVKKKVWKSFGNNGTKLPDSSWRRKSFLLIFLQILKASKFRPFT